MPLLPLVMFRHTQEPLLELSRHHPSVIVEPYEPSRLAARQASDLHRHCCACPVNGKSVRALCVGRECGRALVQRVVLFPSLVVASGQ